MSLRDHAPDSTPMPEVMDGRSGVAPEGASR